MRGPFTFLVRGCGHGATPSGGRRRCYRHGGEVLRGEPAMPVFSGATRGWSSKTLSRWIRATVPGPGGRLRHNIQRAYEALRTRWRAALANGLSSTKAILSQSHSARGRAVRVRGGRHPPTQDTRHLGHANTEATSKAGTARGGSNCINESEGTPFCTELPCISRFMGGFRILGGGVCIGLQKGAHLIPV